MTSRYQRDAGIIARRTASWTALNLCRRTIKENYYAVTNDITESFYVKSAFSSPEHFVDLVSRLQPDGPMRSAPNVAVD
jgi:hypothetical protein